MRRSLSQGSVNVNKVAGLEKQKRSEKILLFNILMVVWIAMMVKLGIKYYGEVSTCFSFLLLLQKKRNKEKRPSPMNFLTLKSKINSKTSRRFVPPLLFLKLLEFILRRRDSLRSALIKKERSDGTLRFWVPNTITKTYQDSNLDTEVFEVQS